jgi:hypothetical protein
VGDVRAASAAACAAPLPPDVAAGATGVGLGAACGMLRVAAFAGGGVGPGKDLLEPVGRLTTLGPGAVRAGGGGGTLDWRTGGGADEITSVFDAPGPEGGHSEDGRSAASEAVPSVTALLTWIT